jgi:hypothetical protein
MTAQASSVSTARIARREGTHARPRLHGPIGIPWILVCLHALVLIASSMFGLAVACYLI